MLRLLVIAFVALTGVAGAVAGTHLAGRSERADWFELDVAPARQELVPGQLARFGIGVSRPDGASEPVGLRVSGLPPGASAGFRLAGGAETEVVPADRTGATLSIDTASETRLGSWRVRVTAEAGGVERSRDLTLSIVRARDGLFRLFTRPLRQLSAPGTTASLDVHVKRRRDFRRPVRLSADGLPRGWVARFARTRVRDETRLDVTPPGDAGRGSAQIVISGSVRWGGRTVRRHQVAVVEVGRPRRFRIGGDLETPLFPGLSAPLDLELDNPHRFAIRLTDLSVSLAGSTSIPACSGSANYVIDQYSGGYPLTLEPGSQRLSDLVGPPALWPQVGMRDLAVSQDECKGARLSLRYQGTAVR
jgi:hypothetical protein